MANLSTNAAINQIAQALTNQNPNYNTNGAINLIAQIIAEAGETPIVLKNLTEAERLALTPEVGMLLYQENGTTGVYYYDVTNTWIRLGASTPTNKVKVSYNVIANGASTSASSGVDTPIAVAGVPTFISTSVDFTSPIAGRILYSGASPITVIVRADTSVQKISSPNRFGRLGINRNGVLSGASLFNTLGGKAAIPFNTLGGNFVFAHQFQITLSNGDYLEWYMNKIGGGTETFSFQTFSITIEEV